MFDRFSLVFWGLKQLSVYLNSSECFPDLLEIPDYLEKIEYVGRIENNQGFISYKYQDSEWHYASISIWPWKIFKKCVLILLSTGPT